MSIARAFTEEERKRHIYESRLSKLREQWEIEAERAQAEAALVEKDKVIFLKDAIIEEERRAKEDAVAELAKMRAELERLQLQAKDDGDFKTPIN